MDTVELRQSMKKLNKTIDNYKKRVNLLEKKVTDKYDYLPEELNAWLNDKIKLLELEGEVTDLMELYNTMKEMDKK
jgi:hypothetical protein